MLPKPKQYAAAATRTSKLISEPLGETRFEYQNAENDAGFLDVCRVCLATNVKIYNISEGELSDMYERVTGFVINAEDRLPRHLCWECVGRLSSANRFVAKALKTHWLLLNEMNSGRLVTIRDIETIDKAQHKLESTLKTKFNTVNEYDFLFTEVTVEPNTCSNIHTSKPVHNDCNEDISDIELNGNEEEQIFIKEEFISEIDPIKMEQVAVDVEKEPNNDTTAYKSSGTEDDKEGYADTGNVIFSNEVVAITIKRESTSDEDVSGDDEGVSEMSHEGRQVVDKSSAVCEVVKQSRKRSNNSVSPLRNKSRKMPRGCKEGIGWTVCKTEHYSSQVTANAEQSTKHIILNKMKNDKPIKNRIMFEDDVDMVKDLSADFVKTVKLPQAVINVPGCTSYNINTNTSMALKSILSGTEYPRNLFICDICDKLFHRKRTLILHIKQHRKMYYCTYCRYKTYVNGHLKEHVNAIHTRSISYECAHCSYKTYKKSNLSIHINGKHTKSEVLNCPHCSYKAYQKSNLSVHVNAKHTKSKVFNCPHCSYRTYIKWCLLRHVNAKHTKNEVLNCPHCSYKAYQKTNLLKHVNAKHTKSEVYNCPHCSYRGYTKWCLLRHVNAKHTKSRSFDCPHCSYKAYQKSTLSTHVNAKHTKSHVFNCPHCSYKAYKESTISNHINAKHTKSHVFNCSFCSYKSFFKQCLIKHLNNKHTQC